MVRTSFLYSGILLLLSLGACGAGATPSATHGWPVDGPWNGDLVIVSVDTLRADRLSVLGGLRDTDGSPEELWSPAWLASQGAVFEQTWAPAGKTLPALGSFWTGLDPLEHGGLSNKHTVLAPSTMQTLAGEGALGLAMVANRSLGPACGLAKGFAGYLLKWGSQENEIASEMTRRSRDAISGKKRLVLWAHFMAPHQPYDPPAHEAARYGGDGLPGSNDLLSAYHRNPSSLSNSERERLRALYDAEIHLTTQRVKQLLSGLDANYRAAGRGGLLDNARVLFLSDHGEALADRQGYFMHAKSLFSGVIRIPFWMAGPGVAKGAREMRSVRLAEILPLTIQGKAPRGGVSCSSWQGKFFAARDSRWTLIHNPSADEHGPLEPPEDVAFHYPTVALFDRDNDALEQHDVSAQHPEVTRQLLSEIRRWWEALAIATPGVPEGMDPSVLAELGYSDSFEEQMTEPWRAEQWTY